VNFQWSSITNPNARLNLDPKKNDGGHTLNLEEEKRFCVINIATYDRFLLFLSEDGKMLVFETKYTPNDTFEYEKSSMRMPKVKFKQICNGDNHILALDYEGYVWGLGSNKEKQLGVPGKDDKVDVFTKLDVGKNYIKVMAVKNTSFFLNYNNIKTIGEVIGVRDKKEFITSPPATIIATDLKLKFDSVTFTPWDIDSYVKAKTMKDFLDSRIFKMDNNDSLTIVISKLNDQIKILRSQLEESNLIRNAFEEEMSESKDRIYAQIAKNRQEKSNNSSFVDSKSEKKKVTIDESIINMRLGMAVEEAKTKRLELVN
jgi:hypothetical protein